MSALPPLGLPRPQDTNRALHAHVLVDPDCPDVVADLYHGERRDYPQRKRGQSAWRDRAIDLAALRAEVAAHGLRLVYAGLSPDGSSGVTVEIRPDSA